MAGPGDPRQGRIMQWGHGTPIPSSSSFLKGSQARAATMTAPVVSAKGFFVGQGKPAPPCAEFFAGSYEALLTRL